MTHSADLERIKRANPDYPIEEVFRQRWSPRAFSSSAVSDDVLRRIFTAGAWAASSYNEQPWRFVIGRKDSAQWRAILAALVPGNQAWAAAAPVLFASFAKITFSHDGSPNGAALHDVGAASAQIALQATALGLHVHGMAGFNHDKLREALGVPQAFAPAACWALGALGDPDTLADNLKAAELKPRPRNPLASFVFGDWEQAAL